MATGFSAVRSGIVMFITPFVFAMYPELLLIEAAVQDPTSSDANAYLPGYDGEIHIGPLAVLLARLVLSLYLLASALARFDQTRLPIWEVALRLALAALVMVGDLAIYGPAVVVALLWIGFHTVRQRDAVA